MHRMSCAGPLLQVILWVGFSLAAISGTMAYAKDIQERHQQLLDNLEQVGFAPSHSALWSMDVHKAVRAEGVSILPALAERYENATTDSLFSVREYGHLFTYIAGFRPYFYSANPRMFGEKIELFEVDTSMLPVVSVSYEQAPQSPGAIRDEWLTWWKRVQRDEDALDRLERMRSAMSHIEPSAGNLDSATWRAYERIAVNHGIFNLPAFILLVKEDNHPVAFAELLRVTMHPASLNVSEYALDPLGRIQAVAANFPEHEERIELVLDWWSNHREQYDALPQLRDAIQASLGASEE